jgi:hypothetical protein
MRRPPHDAQVKRAGEGLTSDIPCRASIRNQEREDERLDQMNLWC